MVFTPLDLHYTAADNHRSAYRATVPGLSVRLLDGTVYPVSDVSATGVGFFAPAPDFGVGAVLPLALLIKDRIYMDAVAATVVRLTASGVVATRFDSLTRAQTARLDKLILEIQKRAIARTKAGVAPASGIAQPDSPQPVALNNSFELLL